MGILEQQIEGLATMEGLSDRARERLQIKYERWERVLERGAIVKLHIKKWGASCPIDMKVLELMGIDIEDEDERKSYAKAMRMGHVNLLPEEVKKQQDRLDSRGRHTLATASRLLPFGYFVPQGELVPLTNKLDDQAKEYMQFVDKEIVGKIDRHQASVAAELRIIFGGAYDRIEQTRRAAGKEMGVGKEEFVDTGVQYVCRKYPHPDDIAESYYFDYAISIVPFQDQVAEQELRAQQLREATAQSEEREQAILAEAQTRLGNKVREQADRERARILESLDQAERDMLDTVRAAAVNIVEALGRNGSLPGSSSTQLANMLKQVKMFRDNGMLRDVDLEEAIDNLDRMAEAYAGYSSAERKQQLPSLSESLVDIANISDVIISEMPTVRGVRRAATVSEEPLDLEATRQPVARQVIAEPEVEEAADPLDDLLDPTPSVRRVEVSDLY